MWAVRGFLVGGSTAPAVALIKQTKIYPLGTEDTPPPMEFLNGSGQPIDTIHTDTGDFYTQLNRVVQEEPVGLFTGTERFYLRAIGIKKDHSFAPTAERAEQLESAAHAGAAFSRAIAFASEDRDTYFYPDRQWQGVGNVPYTFIDDTGVTMIDRLVFTYYMAVGNSPAMMAKNVGVGSQYLWAYRDGDGDFLDGAETYRLRIPADVPINNFWSVVVYDSLSRSELQNGDRFPSVSQYSGPELNADGTVDVYFSPRRRSRRKRTGFVLFLVTAGSPSSASTGHSTLLRQDLGTERHRKARMTTVIQRAIVSRVARTGRWNLHG